MTVFELDLETVLESVDRMASQRPIAARIVAAADNDNAGAAEMAGILSADVPMAAKVMRLANSAYFGLSGRVTSLHLAVAVVGFNTVRSLATVALAGLDDADSLPPGFWDVSLHLAAAAGAIGPQFGEPAADAMCLGLLVQLGAGLLHQVDADGYATVVSGSDLGADRFAAEARRYGQCSPQLTAAALEQWHFPASMVGRMKEVRVGPGGALLRTAYELTARLVQPSHRRISVGALSDGRFEERLAPARLAVIRADVEALRAALEL